MKAQQELDRINSQISEVMSARKSLEAEAAEIQRRHNEEAQAVNKKIGENNIQKIELDAQKRILEKLIQEK